MSFGQSNPVLSATVVICTRERADELDGCLRDVSRLCYPKYEVLVVENGVPDGRTRSLAEQYGVRYLSSPNVGLSRARNDGAKACTTDLVAYLDDDARTHPEWLARLACEFTDPLVMAVGGEELRPVAREEMLRLQAQPITAYRVPRRPRRFIGPQTPEWFSLTNFGGCGCGCSMCFRRVAFELWPGFDERFGRGAILNSAEESFAFFQLVLLGYRCVHTPDAIVWHPGPQTIAEWRRFNLNNMTNAVAYAALLWSEFPQTRGLLIKHLWNRNFGERSRARASNGVPHLSFSELLRVIPDGLRLFSQMPRAAKRNGLISGSAQHIS